MTPRREHRDDSEAPDYDVGIDADELLEDLAEIAADYGRDYEEKNGWWRDSFDAPEPFHEARFWAMEAYGGRAALGEAIAAIQPESHALAARNFREDDGTVDVRGYMHWLKANADAARRDRGRQTGGSKRAAAEREWGNCKVLRLIRDEYGVGWPRTDEYGNPLEADRP